MAQLFSNRACVISARAYPHDEEEFQGIVHFAERSQIVKVFVEKSRDVGNCQKQGFEKFKTKFEQFLILKALASSTSGNSLTLDMSGSSLLLFSLLVLSPPRSCGRRDIMSSGACRSFRSRPEQGSMLQDASGRD
ncbi:unnamed protein product [Prorocentrum cordatum]|uniref:Uncharacterized protein n=1 Tax=Prorocentrum cordatum TaxID=2364126 RepID=A0ABN9U780_9DINO|nr:unnamed protein product [Polarella glacialis]